MQCPITLRPLHELTHPVAFACNMDQPYELDAVCDWLELSCTNPLTGQAASVRDLVGVGGDVETAEMLLRQRSLTIVGNQVKKRFFSCDDGIAGTSSSCGGGEERRCCYSM